MPCPRFLLVVLAAFTTFFVVFAFRVESREKQGRRKWDTGCSDAVWWASVSILDFKAWVLSAGWSSVSLLYYSAYRGQTIRQSYLASFDSVAVLTTLEPRHLGTLSITARFRKNGSWCNPHRTLDYLLHCLRCPDFAGLHVSRRHGYSISKWQKNSRRETSLKLLENFWSASFESSQQ